MIVFVDLEHPQLAEIDGELWRKSRTAVMRKKYRFEALSGRPCLIMRFDTVSPQALAAVETQAVLVSGCYLEFDYFSPDSLRGLQAVYQEWRRPLLGFCAGMQMMAQTYGAAVGPMDNVAVPMEQRPHLILEENETVTQELGFQEIAIRQTNPLFSGLAPTAILFQAHYWEVKWVPPEFQLLASSDVCNVQAIAHMERPMFGTQAHPELYDELHSDGEKILRNFFRMIP